MAGVVASIRHQPPEGTGGLDQVARHDDVVGVAGAEQQDARPALIVHQAMDLGRPAAARAAYALDEGPPFAPAAERWALMEVLSMATSPVQIPVWPVSAWKIPLHTP